MNKEKLINTWGGKRKGAGRKKAKEPTVVFYARVTPKQKTLLEKYLKELKNIKTD